VPPPALAQVAHLAPDDVAIEEQQRRKGLVLRRGAGPHTGSVTWSGGRGKADVPGWWPAPGVAGVLTLDLYMEGTVPEAYQVVTMQAQGDFIVQNAATEDSGPY
jgi:hypothetical protein